MWYSDWLNLCQIWFVEWCCHVTNNYFSPTNFDQIRKQISSTSEELAEWTIYSQICHACICTQVDVLSRRTTLWEHELPHTQSIHSTQLSIDPNLVWILSLNQPSFVWVVRTKHCTITMNSTHDVVYALTGASDIKQSYQTSLVDSM